MSIPTARPGALGFDPEEISRKYREEAERRRPVDQTLSVPVASGTPVSVADPFADPDYTRPALTDEVDVIVLGAGFTGLITAIQLRKAGVKSVRVIDKAAGFGGVWYWNRYPGIRCDVESYIYLPMLEDIDLVPPERYAHGDDIRAHCQALAEKFGLDETACLQTQVTGVRWEAETDRWVVTTDRGDEMRSRFVCLGGGSLDVPVVPDVPGLDEFEGHVFHSSRWDYAYTGGTAHGELTELVDKKVAVIGTSASAIQFIPYLARDAEALTVFQRTPAAVLPRGNRVTDTEWYSGQAAGWQMERIENFTAVVQSPPGEAPPALDLVDDSMTQLFKWTRTPPQSLAAGIAGLDAPTRQLMINYALMEKVRADMGALVDDPETAEAVKPYYNLGCKRPQFSDSYLQSLNAPHVSLVDTMGQGIERLTRTGVVAGGEEYEADCVIFGTGFSVNGARAHTGGFPVIGRGGHQLADKWADGMSSLHGIMTAGFPNLFVIGSISQAAHSFTFSHFVIEQAAYSSALVTRCRDTGQASVEPRIEAENGWQERIAADRAQVPRIDLGCAPDEVFKLVRSGYPGGPIAYQRICRDWLENGGVERDLVFQPAMVSATR
ncbi:flavin-containing monooxygenase [Streptomyces sp. NPDC096311]|uniref:flavin-containing monooxygenase n=1 Tax=Streptomyces sp. NPDC096311 TaxID=3366083 RepID=UPI0038171BBF